MPLVISQYKRGDCPMFGRMFTTMLVMVTLLLVIVGNYPATAADPTKFDPDKKFTVMLGSALMGDPALYRNLGSGLEGGTVVSTAVTPTTGLIIMASLIEPGQNGQPGGGYAVSLKPQEAARLINLLRKAPDWAKIATDNNVQDYSKTVGYVRGSKGDKETVAVVFVVSADNSMSMQLEHQIGGKAKRFQFGINAAMKFSNQLLHYLASAGSEFAPENPKGDAEKDKLFE